MSLGEGISEGSSVERLLLHLNGNSNDDSGNGLNGNDTYIVYGKVYGKFNEGALFTRTSSSMIVIGTTTILQPTTALTFSMWINIRNMPASYCGIAGDTLSGFARGYLYDINTTTLNFYVGNGTWGNVGVTVSTINDGKWHFLCGTWDGSLIKLYVDAKYIGQASKTSIVYTGCGFSLGNYYSNTTYTNMFDGYMDEVRVRSRALSPQEIQKEYTNALGRYAIL
jgi:hypothetical protein